jgi:hypothetical protein
VTTTNYSEGEMTGIIATKHVGSLRRTPGKLVRGQLDQRYLVLITTRKKNKTTLVEEQSMPTEV